MAYLGHRNGPKMSEILKRRFTEINLVRTRGGGPLQVPPKTLQNLINTEEREEAEGRTAEVLIPVVKEVKPGEFFYIRLDGDTNSGIEFYYELNDEEKKQLGEKYLSREISLMTAAEARAYESWMEEIRGSSDFPLFG